MYIKNSIIDKKIERLERIVRLKKYDTFFRKEKYSVCPGVTTG
jgi:hypothetical protein